LLVLLAVTTRLPLQAGAPAPPGPRGPGAAIPRRFWLFAAFAVLYGIGETMNGNWLQLEMTTRLGYGPTPNGPQPLAEG